jgi:hypothetical protein
VTTRGMSASVTSPIALAHAIHVRGRVRAQFT